MTWAMRRMKEAELREKRAREDARIFRLNIMSLLLYLVPFVVGTWALSNYSSELAEDFMAFYPIPGILTICVLSNRWISDWTLLYAMVWIFTFEFTLYPLWVQPGLMDIGSILFCFAPVTIITGFMGLCTILAWVVDR